MRPAACRDRSAAPSICFSQRRTRGVLGSGTGRALRTPACPRRGRCGTAAGATLRGLPDRDRQGRVGPHLGRRRRRGASLPGVWRNPAASQGNRRVKVIVEADGGSRGNPGPAGYGSVVWTADRAAIMAESKQAIGQATNNVAEYRGLIAGLEDAAKVGATEVDVSMDSKLVVEQMSGRWKVKHPDIAALHQQATALATRFDRITYTWIPRAKNSHADRLANEAMDAAAEIEAPSEAPKEAQTPTSPAGWIGASGAPTRFLLLRHGQTELSTQRRYSGRGNPALTEIGRRQAEAAAQFLAQKGGI